MLPYGDEIIGDGISSYGSRADCIEAGERIYGGFLSDQMQLRPLHEKTGLDEEHIGLGEGRVFTHQR